MDLELVRYSDNGESTLGLLFVNGVFECYTLEDERRRVKVAGETRIPAGSYRVDLRTVGGFHGRYSRKFGKMHRGTLWIRDVPGFEYILIHTGNHDKHTRGCVLVGSTANENPEPNGGRITGSVTAYKRIYPRIAAAIANGQGASITVRDCKGVAGQGVLV